MSGRFDLAREMLGVRQQVGEGRTDLRNHTIPYYDVHEFEVHHYADITNGIVKLLKNAEYLIDEIYYRIPTRFRFYTRPQYYRYSDGTAQPLSDDWFLQEEIVTGKNMHLTNWPLGAPYECHEFSAWTTDQFCSAEVDVQNAIGPVSAYALYSVNNYGVHFLDINRNEIDVSGIDGISDYLRVSAFGDVTGISDFNRRLADLIDLSNAQRYSREQLSDMYLYSFDNGYPNSLSNVRKEMYFMGIYAPVAEPSYRVYNYCRSYDGELHGISVDTSYSDGRYAIGYSLDKDGPFLKSPILCSYTDNEQVSVYFQISAYSELFEEYKKCRKVDCGTIQIYKQHLLQEKNNRAVLTENNLSVLI